MFCIGFTVRSFNDPRVGLQRNANEGRDGKHAEITEQSSKPFSHITGDCRDPFVFAQTGNQMHGFNPILG